MSYLRLDIRSESFLLGSEICQGKCKGYKVFGKQTETDRQSLVDFRLWPDVRGSKWLTPNPLTHPFGLWSGTRTAVVMSIVFTHHSHHSYIFALCWSREHEVWSPWLKCFICIMLVSLDICCRQDYHQLLYCISLSPHSKKDRTKTPRTIVLEETSRSSV